jgi:hypothetical protein
MACKTKDIDDAYSESQWISIMIVLQIEVIFVAVPTSDVLRDVSTDGRYIGFVFILWSFPASALSFIILPKVAAYYRAIRGNDPSRVHKRGDSKGAVRVSGLPSIPQSIACANRNSVITRRLQGNKASVTSELSSSPAESSGDSPQLHGDPLSPAESSGDSPQLNADPQGLIGFLSILADPTDPPSDM